MFRVLAAHVSSSFISSHLQAPMLICKRDLANIVVGCGQQGGLFSKFFPFLWVES